MKYFLKYLTPEIEVIYYWNYSFWPQDCLAVLYLSSVISFLHHFIFCLKIVSIPIHRQALPTGHWPMSKPHIVHYVLKSSISKYSHTTYSWCIKWRMGLNGFHIRWIIGTQDNWKNENPRQVSIPDFKKQKFWFSDFLNSNTC